MKHTFIIIASICLLAIAIEAKRPATRAIAAFAGSTGLGFATMTMVLAAERQRKEQEAIAQAYLDFLQRLQHSPQPPKPQRPAACRGCVHYHGKVYNGTMLVCGMHPYGAESETCPDWSRGTVQPPDNLT
jgi:hypothetical protein